MVQSLVHVFSLTINGKMSDQFVREK